MDDNKDLLDLCRLNQMEANIKDSPAPDRDEMMKAIDWKRRHLVVKITNRSAEENKAKE